MYLQEDNTENHKLNEKALLEEILKSQNIRSFYQPIVCLKTGEVVGYEALSRGPKESPLESPDKLFASAKEHKMLWETENLCRAKSIEHFGKLNADYYLFLNVDPEVINDPKFKEGVTKEYLNQHNLVSNKVIFEITEKTSVEDYINFRKVIEYYRNQGYKIALDDTGAGYSGIKMLLETHPNYIKIDIDLVRNIDKDNYKQHFIKQFYQFAKTSGMEVIAEGIETIDELKTLIDIGIQYGQGYLIQRPQEHLSKIDKGIVRLIKESNKGKSYYYKNNPLEHTVENIVRYDKPFPSSTPIIQVVEYFQIYPKLKGIPIVDHNQIVGLLMKEQLTLALSSMYGYALYSKKLVKDIMNINPLVIEANASIVTASETAMKRKDKHLYDYILISKNNKYLGIVTVKGLLENATKLEKESARKSNPLTGLPGNKLIIEKLEALLEGKKKFYIAYIDLDNFKPYNDVYGFIAGDRLLVFLAELLKEKMSRFDNMFLGHVGGDDFIIISENDPYLYCGNVIDSFEQRISGFYHNKDLLNGYIISENRNGRKQRFPFTSLTMAILSSDEIEKKDLNSINEKIAEFKKKGKMKVGSICYIGEKKQ